MKKMVTKDTKVKKEEKKQGNTHTTVTTTTSVDDSGATKTTTVTKKVNFLEISCNQIKVITRPKANANVIALSLSSLVDTGNILTYLSVTHNYRCCHRTEKN
jgi:isoleucyl-tRNA synthetase